MTIIDVILADDHPVVRAGIRALLERASDINIVAEATNGDEVLPLLKRHVPHVLILDIEMPKLSGVEVARQIKAIELPVHILVLSAHSDDHYVNKILRSGASGYLTKEEAPHMIIDAVRGVALGEEGWMSRRAVATISALTRDNHNKDKLTPREIEVLALISDGKTNQEIALELHITESTVEKHVGALLAKLQVASRVEAAVQAVRKGWV